MAQAPQLNDSQLNLLAKIASNTGETQPKHGDGQHNLLFKIAQNTYASAVNGSNIDISDVSGLQSALDGKVESVDPNYVLVKPTDNLAEKYSQIKNYTPSTPSSLLNGLLAFYNLSGVADASSNNNTLTNNGGVTFTSGKIGNAATFNGSTSYLSRASLPNEGCTESTITLWFKDTGSDSADFLIAGGESESEFAIIQSGGDVKGFFTDSGDNFFAGVSNANDGNWHFAAIRFTPTEFKIWVDTTSNSKNGTFSPISPSTYFSIGANWDGTYLLWNGQIDAVGIWNRALTDSEISALYNAGHGIEHPFFRSATNRGTMFVVPGTYPLSSELAIDAEFVDIVGLGAQFQSPAVIVTNNTLNVTANDVRVSGISVGAQQFKTGNNKPLQVFENCKGTGLFSFSGGAGGSGGTFVNCVAGEGGFSGGGFADGKYTNCISGPNSFGAGVEASGVFTNCIGDELSFGSDGGMLTGKLFSCRLSFPGDSYQTPSGSGIIRFCLDGDNNIVNADAP